MHVPVLQWVEAGGCGRRFGARTAGEKKLRGRKGSFSRWDRDLRGLRSQSRYAAKERGEEKQRRSKERTHGRDGTDRGYPGDEMRTLEGAPAERRTAATRARITPTSSSLRTQGSAPTE
jgi:hypothetical protein